MLCCTQSQGGCVFHSCLHSQLTLDLGQERAMASRNKATFNDPTLPPIGLMGELFFYPLFATVFFIFNLFRVDHSFKDHLEKRKEVTVELYCASHREFLRWLISEFPGRGVGRLYRNVIEHVHVNYFEVLSSFPALYKNIAT